MKGKISKIKNTKGELALPVTTVEAVYLEDGKTLNDELNNISSSLDNVANKIVCLNNNNVIEYLSNNLESGKTIVLPAGVYECYSDEFGINLEGLNDITLQGNDTTLLFINSGVLINRCSNITIKGVKIERKTQAQYMKPYEGISIRSCKNVIIDSCCVGKFTDNISLKGEEYYECYGIKITNNYIYRASEEPIASRRYVKNVKIINNKCTEHLGDGILIKGSENVNVIGNHLYNPAFSDNSAYAEMINPAQEYKPICGGGITCNCEDGSYTTNNLIVQNNYLENTLYGVGIIGGVDVKIHKNSFNNILHDCITFNSFTYNPYNNISKNVTISNNTINKIVATNGQYYAICGFDSSNQIANYPLNLMIDANYINVSNETIHHMGIKTKLATITNNIIENTPYAIEAEGCIITNNTILESPSYIKGDGEKDSTSIALVGDGNNILKSNKIKNKGYIRIASWNNVISNNIFEYTGNFIRYFIKSNCENNKFYGIDINSIQGDKFTNKIDDKRFNTVKPTTTSNIKNGEVCYNLSPNTGLYEKWVFLTNKWVGINQVGILSITRTQATEHVSTYGSERGWRYYDYNDGKYYTYFDGVWI